MAWANFITVLCHAQSFEVADVHWREPDSILAMRSRLSQGMFELRNATMVDLIRTAWNVDADKVLGGPEWLEMDRFDVVAAVPSGTSRQDARTMLQALLRERFGLAAHTGKRDVAAYGLTVSKKSLLRAAAAEVDGSCGAQSRPVAGAVFEIACRNVSMEDLARALPKLPGAAAYLFETPVVDRTGLAGRWDLDFRWTVRSPQKLTPATDVTTLFEGVEKFGGLRLSRVMIPAEVVIVDRVNRRPTPNAPGVAERLPREPDTFEVATIKLAAPEDLNRGASVRVEHGGRVQIIMSLKELIEEAWNEFDDDRIVGGPKSMESTRFEVVAKMPTPELDAGPGVFSGADVDRMRIMLKALLKERFRLEAHTEGRLVAGYALVARRPKLRKADPSNRAGCREGTDGRDGVDPRVANPLASRLVTCRNVTMAQFARQLHDTGYFPPMRPIVDSTGLQGRYDLSINYSPPRLVQSVNRAPARGEPQSLDPTGVISLEQAVEKLGLRLQSRTLPGEVLVIDRVDEMPSEN